MSNPTRSQSEPSTRKGMDTRERIVAGARVMLIERGFEAFALRELAAALEMKLGNLQYYFSTRDALILHVIEIEAAADVAAIERHVEQISTPAVAFDAVIKELVTRWRGHSGVLFATLNTLALHSASFKQLYRAIYERFYSALERLVTLMNPTVPPAEVRLRVRLITALIDGSAMQVNTGRRDVFLERLQRQARSMAMGS